MLAYLIGSASWTCDRWEKDRHWIFWRALSRSKSSKQRRSCCQAGRPCGIRCSNGQCFTFSMPTYSQGMHGYAYQSVGEVSPRPTEKEAPILLIHHLPEAIPHDTLSRLFSHCFLRLSMHYWKDEELFEARDDATAAIDLKQESMMNSLPTLEPIAEKLGMEYPCPPHLEITKFKSAFDLKQVGGHHTQAAFAFRGKEPKDEVHIYTWMDATPCELTDLVAPEARRRDALLSFAFVYLTKTSHFTVKEVKAAQILNL
ncbi:hypothetical protein L1987_81361 [Smallanthus sonchifolius]|uniref:Uncharacterized protein n=1 Tax=Smallanthus sonchifolius TaxID=185202 RepID=A0ACB8YQZ6_9ASTR|nr:hypothetical protein L1987_81361 [Smallanthus sonchifolius]